MDKTYMWREYPSIRGDKHYRYQTNNPDIHKKMRQRKDFKLVLWSLNSRLWVYVSKKNTLEKAKRTLGNLTRDKVKKVTSSKLFYTENAPYIASK